jgi:hypothetical protein
VAPAVNCAVPVSSSDAQLYSTGGTGLLITANNLFEFATDKGSNRQGRQERQVKPQRIATDKNQMDADEMRESSDHGWHR